MCVCGVRESVCVCVCVLVDVEINTLPRWACLDFSTKAISLN